MEAENSNDFSCLNNLTVKLQPNLPENIPFENQYILQTSNMSRIRADSQTSTYSDCPNSGNMNQLIKSHETTNSASYNSETMTIPSNKDNSNGFPVAIIEDYTRIKIENNRLREVNEELEEYNAKLRCHLTNPQTQLSRNQTINKRNVTSSSKSDSDKSRNTLETKNCDDTTNTVTNDSTIENETPSELEHDLVRLIEKQQELREVKTQLAEEKKHSKDLKYKCSEKSSEIEKLKYKYERSYKRLQEEKKRRNEIENHHELVYACTRNKLKVVNEAKQCLEAQNHKLRSLINENLLTIESRLSIET